MTKRSVIAITMLLVLAVAPVAIAGGGPDAAALYKSKCAMCHGADGAGQTPTGKAMKVRSLASPEVQKATDTEMAKIIADGKGKMPAYKAKLSAEEITALVGFIRGLKK